MRVCKFQHNASTKDGIASTPARITAEYDTAQIVLDDVSKLTLANRSSDREIENEVRELVGQVGSCEVRVRASSKRAEFKRPPSWIFAGGILVRYRMGICKNNSSNCSN